MLHTIIGELDIFYSDSSAVPQLYQRQCKNGIITMIKGENGLKPYSFFSTDPGDYINKDKKPL